MSNKNKVFISWSGERAKAVSEILTRYLESCIQQIDVFFSDESIQAGQKFLDKIDNNLKDAVAAVVVVTPENERAPWLNYEAGAIGNTTTPDGSNRKVISLLVGYRTETDYDGPLSQYQNVLLNRDGILELTRSICTEIGVDHEKFGDLFVSQWEKTKDEFAAIQTESKKDAPAERSDREYLEEILTLTRSLAHGNNPTTHRHARPTTGLFADEGVETGPSGLGVAVSG